MNLTELLIIGYDADGSAVTARLAPGQASTVQSSPDAEGIQVVDGTSDWETAAFTAVCGVLESLPSAPAQLGE